MENAIQVELSVLTRGANAASVEEARYYLRGVYLGRIGKSGVAVATNGQIMSVERFDVDAAANWTPQIVSVNAIKQIEKSAREYKRTRKHMKAAPVVHIKAGQFQIEVEGDATPWIPVLGECFIDGTFPNWLAIVPHAAELKLGHADGIDSSLYAAIAACAPVDPDDKNSMGQIVRRLSAFQSAPGNPVILRNTSNDWFGIIMPMRTPAEEAKRSSIPLWIEAQRNPGMKAAA